MILIAWTWESGFARTGLWRMFGWGYAVGSRDGGNFRAWCVGVFFEA